MRVNRRIPPASFRGTSMDRRAFLATTLGTTGALLLGACGDDDNGPDEAGPDTTGGEPEDAATSSATSEPDGDPVERPD